VTVGTDIRQQFISWWPDIRTTVY